MLKLRLANGRLLMFTSHIVEFDSVIVDVVQDGQTLFLGATVGLRSSSAFRRPRILTGLDGFAVAVFPNQSVAIKFQKVPCGLKNALQNEHLLVKIGVFCHEDYEDSEAA